MVYRELVQPFSELDPDSKEYLLNLNLKKKETLTNPIISRVDLKHTQPEKTHYVVILQAIAYSGYPFFIKKCQNWAEFVYKEPEQASSISGPLLAFLKERPTARHDSKSLHIGFNYLTYFRYRSDPVSQWCQIMSKIVDLTSLIVELQACKTDLDLLALGEGLLQELTSLRNLKVGGDFKLHLYVSNQSGSKIHFFRRHGLCKADSSVPGYIPGTYSRAHYARYSGFIRAHH
ncbi:hypothetical protein BKA65DRAFT_472978 [Rhexocercosporidium sp. MPI-PUGE-AT-0058]|nr:hypothetical protein BKA65DRAFT_472978 [Rhexocercosporidium sp. MPI-PUGE-AT-0058]